MHIMLHEAGHSLGLDHSRAHSQMTATSTQSDFGDTYDCCGGCDNGAPSYQGARAGPV